LGFGDVRGCSRLSDYAARSSIPVVIPAFEPDESLIDYIGELWGLGFKQIILVDDGSGFEFAGIFKSAETKFGCEVLVHKVNLGKGAALKSAFEFVSRMSGLIGVVTADADGQHAAIDVGKVADALLDNQSTGRQSLILGSRALDTKEVPWKSRFGNLITSLLIRVLFGKYISDSQTGLRGIPHQILMSQQKVRGSRFEYEMAALFRVLTDRLPIDEIPISTIYHNGMNKQTHFRPLVDSVKIYFVIFGQFIGFASSSIISALVDIALFVLIIDLLFGGSPDAGSVIVSVTLARVCSSLLNFSLNKALVFSNEEQKRKTALRYYSLAIVVLILSALGSALMAQVLAGRVVWAKILVDCLLFIFSYLMQRHWVFGGDPGEKK
jgi:putative flippase GtrA